MKKTAITLLITLGLGTALFAFGPGGGKCGGPFGERKGGMFTTMKQLDLSSEQRDAMKEIMKSRKNEMQAKRKEMQENRKEMMQGMRPDLSTFMTADKFDKVAFKAHMEQKFEAKRKMMQTKKDEMLEKRATGMEKMFNILTPEQRTKWIELSKEKQIEK